jgi:hypothetical protein
MDPFTVGQIQEVLGQTTLERARRYAKTRNNAVRNRVRALPDLGPNTVGRN